ncbi:hypothetical protein K501DRAFT_247276 [Backusella circina FSU 941]|nr:hypothetical protein K501DRAFT_247276 [Backusella circina FSU 941]
MSPVEMNEIPAVRLASGIEMQQRWPSSQSSDQPKTEGSPRLIEMTPTRGCEGGVITVVVQSLPQQSTPVKLAFNSLVVDTKQMQSQGITSLVASVPPFQHTHSATSNVPISICILDKDSVTETYPVAEFTYDGEQKEPESIIKFTPTKNLTIPTPTFEPRENFLSSSAAVCENFYQQPVNEAIYNGFSDQMPQYPYPYNREIYNENKFTDFRTDTTGQARFAQQSLNTLNYNNTTDLNLFNTEFTGMFTGFDNNNNESNEYISQKVTPMACSLPVTPLETPQEAQPIQTNQIGSNYSYGKSSTHIPATSVANYQPYPGLVSRAYLKIVNDLDIMAKNWSPEEWDNRRRIVQFWREQNGNEIRCTFNPVSQGEYFTSNSGHIVVSCIYWAERNDCFITSVDCIHLLESLMDIRFSVEEKNRVRRNLEGFRPLTVSKCKPESAEFFKLIMGFPNPKPRNIEKDVKVFPWKTLPYALKKIVTKYTASSYGTGGNHQRRPHFSKSASSTPMTTPLSTPLATPTPGSYPAATSYFNQPIISQDNLNSFYPQQNNVYYQGQNPSIYQNNSSGLTTPKFAAPYSQKTLAANEVRTGSHSPSYNTTDLNDIIDPSHSSPESLFQQDTSSPTNQDYQQVLSGFDSENI